MKFLYRNKENTVSTTTKVFPYLIFTNRTDFTQRQEKSTTQDRYRTESDPKGNLPRYSSTTSELVVKLLVGTR